MATSVSTSDARALTSRRVSSASAKGSSGRSPLTRARRSRYRGEQESLLTSSAELCRREEVGAATAASPVTCPGVGSSSPGPSPSERSSKSSRNESASVAIAAFVVCPLVA